MSAILVCATADARFEIAGASFDQRCGRCDRSVMIAPSGREFMRNHSGTEIMCSVCYLSRPADPGDTFAPVAIPDVIAAELASARPNLRRNRN